MSTVKIGIVNPVVMGIVLWHGPAVKQSAAKIFREMFSTNWFGVNGPLTGWTLPEQITEQGKGQSHEFGTKKG